MEVNKRTKKRLVKICKYTADYSCNFSWNLSDIHEGICSILQAAMGRSCDEMDSTRMPLSF